MNVETDAPADRPRVKVLQREPRSNVRVKNSPSDTNVVDLARRDSSGEGRTDGEPDPAQMCVHTELVGIVAASGANSDANTAANIVADGAAAAVTSLPCTPCPEPYERVDRVLFGALKKSKFNPKIREIEGIVRDFVLNSTETELSFEKETTDTTFERLLVHRVSQHWGLETRVLEDRCTIVGTWPEGRERVEPEVVLGSLELELEEEEQEIVGTTRMYDSGRSRERRDRRANEKHVAGGPYDTRYFSMAETAAHGSYTDHQLQFYYQQMMYQQQHHQMMMMHLQQQGVNGMPGMSGMPPMGMSGSGYTSPAGRSSDGSPGRQVPGSPASTMSTVSMMSMGSEFERAHAQGMGSPGMFHQINGGYMGPPNAMMMGTGMPGMHGPYGMHMPVVPIMLPDGRIVYQQQPIQPIAVPPPPPPAYRRRRSSDGDMKRSNSGKERNA